MNGVGDPLVSLDRFGPIARNHLLVRSIRRMRRVFLGDDQTRTAAGPRLVVARVLLRRQPVLRVIGQVCGEHDPIAECQVAQAQWREEARVRRHQTLEFP